MQRPPTRINADLLPDVETTYLSTPYLMARTARADLQTYRRAPPGTPLRGPVFVVGSPRSGTTFLGNALSSLPGVSYHFEPIAIKAALPYIYLGVWGEARSRTFVKGVHGALTSIHGDWRRTLIDKQPSAVFILDRLHRWYPRARFIVLQRDGRDVAASWAAKPWLQANQPDRRVEPGGYVYGPNPHFWVEPDRIDEFRSTTTEHRCAWGWRRHVNAWLDQKELLPETSWTEIRYEAMVTDPQLVAGELSEFLDLKGMAIPTLFRNLEAADDESVGRWRTEAVSSDTKALEEMEPLLKATGYE